MIVYVGVLSCVLRGVVLCCALCGGIWYCAWLRDVVYWYVLLCVV